MKVIVVLLVLLAFFVCAMLGYNMASQAGFLQPVASGAAPVDLNGTIQNNVLVIVVDQMDQPEPKLMAVWFVSLYLMDGSQPALTLAPIYTLSSSSTQAQTLREKFSLNAQLEPTEEFWTALAAYNIEWQGYVVADLLSAGRFVEWSGIYPDPNQSLVNALSNPVEGQTMAGQLCQAISAAWTRPPVDTNWSELVPNHFRTNLRMESALLFWQRMTHASPPVRCEILPPS